MYAASNKMLLFRSKDKQKTMDANYFKNRRISISGAKG